MYKKQKKQKPTEEDRQKAAEKYPPEVAKQKTLRRAVNILSAKSRSTEDLKNRLREKAWSNEEAIEYAINKLTTMGFLNDYKFATNFIASKLSARGLGKKRLAFELKRKKVPQQIIDRALEEAFGAGEEEKLIEEAIEKRLRLRPVKELKDKKSLVQFLLRRGFNPSLVIKKTSSIKINKY